MPRGLFRETGGWGDEDSARVQYPDGTEMDVPKSQYESKGYEPPFDSLPMKANIDDPGLSSRES